MSEHDWEELKKDADNGELTQETLQQKLNAYSEALRQEFEKDVKANPQNVPEFTTTFFRDNAASMAAQVVWLANNADSESVRLSACKYGLDVAMADAIKEGDPLRELLKGLSKNDKKQPQGA